MKNSSKYPKKKSEKILKNFYGRHSRNLLSWGHRRKVCRLTVSYWPTKHTPESGSPSIFPRASTEMVMTAGTDHEMRWKYCDWCSIASPDHFKTEAMNQVMQRTSHHMAEDIVEKYRIMNRTVHDCFLVPWEKLHLSKKDCPYLFN